MRLRLALAAFGLALAALLAALFAAPAGAQARIENTATLTVTAPDGTQASVSSPTVVLVVARRPRPSALSLRSLPAGFDAGAARCDGAVLATAPLDAAALALAAPRPTLEPAAGDVVVLTAPGRDRDPQRRETVTVTLAGAAGERTLLLTETAPASGVFAGAVPPSPALAACRPPLARGERARLAFAGDLDSLPATLDPLVDPAGTVFDAATGRPVDGVAVTLVDEAGRPATVTGDDGRSAYPATVTSGTPAADAAGTSYPVGPGGFRFPAVAPGRYRLRLAPPAGWTAPSRADPAALAALRDGDGRPFRLGAADGVMVLAAEPVMVDVPVDPAAATAGAGLALTAAASVRVAEAGDPVEFRLHLANPGTAPTGPVTLVAALPLGLRLRAGSWRGGTVTGGDPRRATLLVPSLAPGAGLDLAYLATVAPGAAAGDAVTAYRAAAGGLSAVASAAVRLRRAALADALVVLGRVTAGPCALPAGRRARVGGVRLLLDDGSVAVTDADGLYHLEGVTPGRHLVALDPASLGGARPLDCRPDTRGAGSGASRFVEGAGGLVRRADFFLADRPGAAAPAPVPEPSAAWAAGDRDWLADAAVVGAPGPAWLFPAPDHNPRAPVVRVAIRHRPGQRVELLREGRAVDPLAFDATDVRGDVAVSRWSGIALAPGPNHLAARVLGADGRLVATLDRLVTVSGPPRFAALVPGAGRLVADGIAPPTVAVRVTDAAGRPVRAGTPIAYMVAAPYAAAVGPGGAGGASAPVRGDDGVALLPLRPAGAAGEARLTLLLDDGGPAPRPVPVAAWLAPAPRPWTVVGFAAGTLGHDLLARHARALPAGQRGGGLVDGELSLYAAGRVRGAWLLTLAVDSARRRDPDRLVGGAVDPARWYTVYGDAGGQGHDAPTAGRLYLRLEGPAFQALFGDTRTGLGDARLARYDRAVTGGRAEWRGRGWRAAGFAARPDTLAGRDELAGTGLAGPYRLRVRPIVPGSDRLRREVRDALRPGLVLLSEPLARDLDYTLDPVAGTLRFAAPLPARDANGNPVVVVADYEVPGGRTAMVAGGRVERRVGRATLAATALADDTLGRGRLAGIDARLALGGGTALSAEVAAGGWRGFGSGTALAVEARHRGARLDADAYLRRQAAGFGLGQQDAGEAGAERVGGDLSWRLADGLALAATGWTQYRLAAPGRQLAGEARLDWTRGPRTLFAGLRLADDDLGDATQRSRLVTLGARQVLAGGAVTLEGRADLAPGGERGSAGYPEQRRATLAWQALPALRLVAGWEEDTGPAATTRTLRAGLEATPWRGGTASAALAGQAAGDDARRYVQYGLSQSLPLGGGLTLDATLDAARTVAGWLAPAAAVTAFQPAAALGAGAAGAAQDRGDYAAATLGLAWRDGRWSGRARLERRDGALDTRTGLSLDLARDGGEGRSLRAGARLYQVTTAAGAPSASVTGDAAFAWRVPGSAWSLLDRLTARHVAGDPGAAAAGGAVLGTSPVTLAPGEAGRTDRVANSLALHWQGARTEAALSYGVKWVRGRYADEVAAGLVDATALEVRRSLGPRADIGLAASAEHGWTDRVWAWSGGPSVGVTPGGGLWLSAGWNWRGYRDPDLAGDRYTRAGPYLTLRAKLAAGLLKGLGR